MIPTVNNRMPTIKKFCMKRYWLRSSGAPLPPGELFMLRKVHQQRDNIITTLCSERGERIGVATHYCNLPCWLALPRERIERSYFIQNNFIQKSSKASKASRRPPATSSPARRESALATVQNAQVFCSRTMIAAFYCIAAPPTRLQTVCVAPPPSTIAAAN